MMMFWFHASESGGHRGFNKTNGRMRQYVGWPNMSYDIKQYISGCPCRRILTMSNSQFKGIRGILEAPRPHEVVSIDFIGPREWGGETYYITCIVDHATRYMFNAISKDSSTNRAIKALKRYCSIFGAPKGVLHDNGTEFVSRKFQEYLIDKLCCRSIKSSPYYPQGNGINESSHQSIKAMLSSYAMLERRIDFHELMMNITMVYNAMPHERLGSTPHYAMFGCELTFPGWQDMVQLPSKEEILANHRQNLLKGLVREFVRKLEKLAITPKSDPIKVGDWVRFKMSDYERNNHAGSALVTTSVSLQPVWSLPAKVNHVHKGQLEVQLLGQPDNIPRKVPMKYVRKLPMSIPASIASLNVQNILWDTPRKFRNTRSIPLENTMSVEDIIRKSSRGQIEVFENNDIFYNHHMTVNLDEFKLSDSAEAEGDLVLKHPRPVIDRRLSEKFKHVNDSDISETEGDLVLKHPRPDIDQRLLDQQVNVGFLDCKVSR